MNELTHSQIQTLLEHQADGLLPQAEQTRVNEHLSTCAACRDYARELNTVETRLRGGLHRRWDFARIPNLYSAPALNKYSMRKLMQQYTFRFFRFAFLTAFLLLVLAGSLDWFLSTSTSTGVNAPSQMPSPEVLPVFATTPDEKFTPLIQLEGWLVYWSTRELGGKMDIYLNKASGSEEINLTSNSASDYQAVWSPDGQQIAFTSNQNGDFQIFLMNADGTGVKQLTSRTQLSDISFCSSKVSINQVQILEGGYFGLSWSPDGKFIVSTLPLSMDGNMFEPLFLIRTDGSGVTQLTEGNDVLAHWSPDGQQILFHRFADCNGGGHGLFSIRPDGSELANLTNNSAYDITDFAWSPDGSQIAYLATNIEQNEKKYRELRVMDRNGANLITLYSEPVPKQITYSGSLDWSPNGTILAFVMPGDNQTLMRLIDSDGTNLQLLTTAADHYFDLDWSPDGNWLAFIAGIDTPIIYILDVRNTPSLPDEWLRLTPPNSQNFGVSWQPLEKERPLGYDQVDLFSAPLQNASWNPQAFKYTLHDIQAKIDFAIKAPTQLPKGYFFVGAAWYGRDRIEIAFSNRSFPMSLTEKFVSNEQTDLTSNEDFPVGTPTQEVVIGETIGIYWQGRHVGGDGGQFRTFDSSLGEHLRWQEDGIVYEISTFGSLYLGIDVLAQMARSMETDSGKP